MHKSHQLGRSDGSVRPVMPLRVMLLEPSQKDAERVVEALRADGLEPLAERCVSLDALQTSLAGGWDVLITSDDLPDGTLEDVLTAAHAGDPDLPIIAVSLSSGDRFALEALRAGATDFIDKAELERLAPAVRRAVADSSTRRDSRHASAQLETSEMRFRAAVEGGFDAFFVLDRELDPASGQFRFRLVEMNSHTSAVLGGTREELVGRFFDDFAAANQKAVAYFSDRFNKVFELGTAFEEEYEVQTDAIEARWLHYQVVPIASGVAVTVRDITGRKRGQAALHESERRFLNVVQHVPGVFFTLVPNDGERSDRLRFDFLSDGIKAITGHDAREFEGVGRISFVDLLHPDDRATLSEADDQMLAGESFSVDVRLVHTDGTTRWAHLKAMPNLDAEGRVQSASGFIIDITDRKQTEEALHVRERAIEAMTQGLVIMDATSDETPIVYVNPAFEELSGYSHEELVGRPLTMFDGPEADSDTVRELRAALAARQPFNGDAYTHRKDGTPYRSSIRVSPVFDKQGNVTHFISIHTDDSLRRRFDEQVLQAQKMEAVGRLAGGIAHDFNNVLLVIRGYSHVLMTMAGDEGEGWAEAKEIETAATRASELVRQLLAFSRSQVMQASVLDVNDVVLETQKLLEPLMGEGIEVRTSLDSDAGSVKADRTQLEQAIVNLAVNARDAMPSGGSLVIRTQNVLVGVGMDDLALTPGEYAAISIEDTGLGMDADTRARVFEPFFSTKDATQATGLGLAAVYGMIKQSGGDITVASVPGEGTSVTIYLPHAHELVLAHTSSDEPNVAAPLEETVLLVEDNHEARVLVGRVLRESGYTVHEAALPDEALRLCDEVEGRIDLLLSDVVMPQMSGPKLAKIVVERRPDTRVMFVSGYIERPDDVDDVSAASEFLQKPFTPAELIETVRRVLRSEAVQA